MGFSALDGLPMGTRSGQLDPGVVLYMMQQDGMSADEIAEFSDGAKEPVRVYVGQRSADTAKERAELAQYRRLTGVDHGLTQPGAVERVAASMRDWWQEAQLNPV